MRTRIYASKIVVSAHLMALRHFFNQTSHKPGRKHRTANTRKKVLSFVSPFEAEGVALYTFFSKNCSD